MSKVEHLGSEENGDLIVYASRVILGRPNSMSCVEQTSFRVELEVTPIDESALLRSLQIFVKGRNERALCDLVKATPMLVAAILTKRMTIMQCVI